jgi:hypothetical protein
MLVHDGNLHDRASYRYFWQVIERALPVPGVPLPETVRWLDLLATELFRQPLPTPPEIRHVT